MPRFYSVLKKDYINEHVTAANYEHKQTTIEDDIGIAIDQQVHDVVGDYQVKELIEGEHKKEKVLFMPTSDGQAFAEGIVSLWKITKNGQLSQLQSKNFQYDGDYAWAHAQQSRLQLSTDKKYVSLCLHKGTSTKNEKGEIESMYCDQIQFFAWHTSKLEPIHERVSTSQEVWKSVNLKGIEEPLEGNLRNMRIVGKSQYVFRESIRFREMYHKKDYIKQYVHWEIFNIISGEKVYEINNLYESQETKELKQNRMMADMNIEQNQGDKYFKDTEEQGFEVRLVGLIAREKNYKQNAERDGYGNEVDDDAERWDPMDDSGSEQANNEDAYSEGSDYGSDVQSQTGQGVDESQYEQVLEEDEFEGGSGSGSDKEISVGFEDLQLVFFFAKDLNGELAGPQKAIDEATGKNKKDKDKKKNKKDKKDKNKSTKSTIWFWTKVKINLKVILEKEERNDTESRKHYINELGDKKFKNYKNQIEKKDEEQDEKLQKELSKQDFFEIASNWFSGITKNWEHQVIVNANQYFKHFGFQNSKASISKCLIYNWDEFQAKSMIEFTIPNGQIATFGRNQHCKQFMMISTRTGNNCKSTIYYDKDTKESISFNNDHEYAWQDCQTIKLTGKTKSDFECDYANKVFLLQSVTLSAGDQEIHLKTQVKAKKTEDNQNFFEEVEKKSRSQYCQGQFPVFCYNVGFKKLIVQNTLEKKGEEGGKQWVLELAHNEQFICFIDFKDDADLGFSPEGLRIEGCSKFAYLTINTSKRSPIAYINVLLVDPYNDKPQICTFKSSKCIDIGEIKQEHDTDTVIKAFMYNTKKTDDDVDYDFKIIVQYPNHYATYKLEDKKDEGQGEEDSYSSLGSSAFDSESDEEDDLQRLAKVPFIQDENGYIYLVKLVDGNSNIYEINPTNDDDELLIYSLKSNGCFGFGQKNGAFYFMDDTKRVIKLERVKEQRLLFEKTAYNIKDKDRPNFKEVNTFSDIIISERYIIQKSQIFYLYENEPLASGILDMEDLSTQDKSMSRRFSAGPFPYKGANTFVIIYQSREKNEPFKWYQKIYALPDSTTTPLLGDYQNKVDMSTFLSSGQILVKLGFRFMIYNTDGIFRDEIAFDNAEEDIKTYPHKNTLMKNIGAKVQNQKDQVEAGDKDEAKQILENFQAGDNELIAQNIKKEKKEEIGKHNRMKLQKSSIQFKYFLFEDRIKKKLGIYELKKDDTGEWTFTFVYDLDLHQDDIKPLFNILDIDIGTGIQDDDIEVFFKILNAEEKRINVQIEENGNVTFTINKHEIEAVTITIYACMFVFNEDKGIADYKDFQIDCDFDKDAKKDVIKRLNLQQTNLEYLLKIEDEQQSHLQKAFQNKTKTKELEKKIRKVKDKKNNTVFSQIYDENLLLVQCGRYIQYGYFTQEIWDDDDKTITFEKAKINFSKDILIEKIWGTQKDYNLQIVAVDDVKQILFLLTWDFRPDKNIESSMLQFNIEPDTQPQNYLVKGMKEKMNYFLNKYQIFDLEYNIPLQTTNFNSLKGEGIKNHTNQRKIFKDPSKSLSIDHGHILNFPLNRIDLIFWMNISGLGEDPEQITQNTSIESFNVIYDGQSLLHYFAGNQDVISAIHEKYKSAKEDGTLTKEQINMPLVMLHPDPKGKTAIDLALAQKIPKSVELMIDMLKDFPDFCLSKMMLVAFPSMIQSGYTIVNKFFDTATFKPALYQHSVNCIWPEDQTEYIFPSETSLITEDALNQIILGDTQMQMRILIQRGQQALGEAKEEEETHGKDTDQIHLRDQQLTTKNQHEAGQKRLQIEAIDFDWIFKGDNAKTFLKLLNEEDSELFLSKSIKIFIEFMWKYYWPIIMKKVFIPYLGYLLCFVYLSSSVAGDYLLRIKEHNTKTGDPLYEVSKVWTCGVLSIICFGFLVKFSYLEVIECYNGPRKYIQSFWNWFDLLQFFLNLSFLMMLGINVSTGFNTINIHSIRTIGALAGWVMWIKVFYWMRLFKETSYFIILIERTCTDSASFMIMLFIILFAYANLNFILQMNIEGPEYKDDVYVTEYIAGYNKFNAIMAQYMIALGQFEAGSIGTGPSMFPAWCAFLSSSYVLTIVFMNLLIAIMGNTFGEVLDMREQAALLTVIQLMNDNINSLDHKTTFKNMRYIIRVSPDVQTDDDGTDIIAHVGNIGQAITTKQDAHQKQMLKKIQVFEKGARSLMKNQANSMLEIKTLIGEVSEYVTSELSAKTKTADEKEESD